MCVILDFAYHFGFVICKGVALRVVSSYARREPRRKKESFALYYDFIPADKFGIIFVFLFLIFS